MLLNKELLPLIPGYMWKIWTTLQDRMLQLHRNFLLNC